MELANSNVAALGLLEKGDALQLIPAKMPVDLKAGTAGEKEEG